MRGTARVCWAIIDPPDVTVIAARPGPELLRRSVTWGAIAAVEVQVTSMRVRATAARSVVVGAVGAPNRGSGWRRWSTTRIAGSFSTESSSPAGVAIETAPARTRRPSGAVNVAAAPKDVWSTGGLRGDQELRAGARAAAPERHPRGHGDPDAAVRSQLNRADLGDRRRERGALCADEELVATRQGQECCLRQQVFRRVGHRKGCDGRCAGAGARDALDLHCVVGAREDVVGAREDVEGAVRALQRTIAHEPAQRNRCAAVEAHILAAVGSQHREPGGAADVAGGGDAAVGQQRGAAARARAGRHDGYATAAEPEVRGAIGVQAFHAPVVIGRRDELATLHDGRRTGPAGDHDAAVRRNRHGGTLRTPERERRPCPPTGAERRVRAAIGGERDQFERRVGPRRHPWRRDGQQQPSVWAHEKTEPGGERREARGDVDRPARAERRVLATVAVQADERDPVRFGLREYEPAIRLRGPAAGTSLWPIGSQVPRGPAGRRCAPEPFARPAAGPWK